MNLEELENNYFFHIKNGDISKSELILAEICQTYLQLKQQHKIFMLCNESFKTGAIGLKLLKIYIDLIKFNPDYLTIQIYQILKKKGAYTILCQMTFVKNIWWLSQICIHHIKDELYLKYLIDSLKYKKKFSLFEYKILLKVILDIQIDNRLRIDYKDIFNSYCQQYNKQKFSDLLIAYS